MRLRPLAPLALAGVLLAGCTTMAAGEDPTLGLANPQVTTRTESNGDVVSEYRVAGQLRVVKVVPHNGVPYFIYDRNGDGRPDTTANRNDRSPVTYYQLFGW